ncbi:MAG: arsenate reductase (glutaredoxin) [Alphaproteobacteria bacterium]|nr:arsenate reductase (glutaredoxin) [Alphaproteobacteria bacterium]
MTVTIYHNPRCSKSRAALKYLEDEKVEFELVTYLDAGLTADKITDILQALDVKAKDVMRKGEKVYKELGLGNEDDEAKLIAAIVANPILLERPIVVKDDKAAIARPLENVMALF